MLCYHSSQEMACIPADDPCNSGGMDYSYVNTNFLCGYEPEHSQSGVHAGRNRAHGPSSCFNNIPFGCAQLHSSSNVGYSPSIHTLDSDSSNEPWYLHPAVEDSTALLTKSNTQSTYYQDGTGTSSWPLSGRVDLFSGAIVTEPAVPRSESKNTPPAERWSDFPLGIKPQNEARQGFNGTTKHNAGCSTTPLFDLDETSFPIDVPPVTRTGCYTSSNWVNTSSQTVEDRLTQYQNAINEGDHQEASLDRLLSTFPGCHPGYRVSAHINKHPIHPWSSSPKDTWLATSSTSSPAQASTLGPVDESWTCSACGRVLLTKGTKNRNRNKRRHHCPGTGPKYPCHKCSKVFKRDDTLLLHLRKQHPETNVEPPQPRKRKTL